MGPNVGKVFVDILGEARLRSPEGGVTGLTVTQASVLTRLLLAHGQPIHEQWLRDVLPRQGSNGAVEKHVSDIRRLLEPFGVLVPHKRPGLGQYRLPLDGIVVDALAFQEEVAGLIGQIVPEQADQLLAMWRGDPRVLYTRIPSRLWGEVFRARDQLVGAIMLAGGMPKGWTRFADLFPEDPRVQRVTGMRLITHAPTEIAADERLLIVEDRIGEYLCSRLAPYDCQLVRSLGEWRGLLREKSGGLDFDAAIIDLHLNEENDDFGGLDVLEYLRDNTKIPAALLTAHIMPGIVEDMKEEYRIALIIHKDPSGSVADIRNAVSRLLRSG